MSGFTIMEPGGLKYPYVRGVEWRKNTVERKDPVPKDLGDRAVKQEEKPYDTYARWKDTIESAETHVKQTPREGRAPIASDIMSHPVVTLAPEDSLKEAFDLVCVSRFRHLPVLSEGQLVGMISDRGILLALHEKMSLKRYVKDVMVRHVLYAHPTTKISRIAQVFWHERIGAMPIVNEKGELVGLLTRSDILRLLMKMPSFNINTE